MDSVVYAYRNEIVELKNSENDSNEKTGVLVCIALSVLTVLSLFVQSPVFSGFSFADKTFTLAGMVLIFTSVLYAVSEKREPLGTAVLMGSGILMCITVGLMTL